MAKKISIITVITLTFISLGCQSPNTGSSNILPYRTSGPSYTPGPLSANAGEVEINELIVKARTEYRQALEMLKNHYIKVGNNEKQKWATTELEALDKMPWYDYISWIEVPGIEPTTQIMDADLLYNDALLQKNQAEKLGTTLFLDKNLYRSALTKFKQLMRNYNKSDKVDDAAYWAGEISENLGDYTQALDFYKASYKWDAEILHPARFRAARILDKNMKNYAEALTVYRQAVEIEGRRGQYGEWKRNAEERIKVLEKTVQP